MNSTLITIEIEPAAPLSLDFTGSIFRGWLGFTLKCHPKKSCDPCEERENCPYYMIFKERTDIKPFSLLSFPVGESIKNYIKIHGDRRRLTGEILRRIEEKKDRTHFGGLNYSITALEARNITVVPYPLKKRTRINFVSPIALETRNNLEILPSFSTILKSAVRTYNRITKYYSKEDYPMRVPDDMTDGRAPILDFDVKKVTVVHDTMEKRHLVLHGATGWVLYDTSACHPKAGDILKIGEMLQIGKHSTYGFGGYVVSTGDDL